MKIGIVIISYNNEDHIEDTIKSLKKQDLQDWSCAVVDNDSTDQTFEIIQQIIADDDRFTAYRKSNEGPGEGRNFGYSKLPKNIEYIHFLDGDDMLYPNFLSHMVFYLDQHPHVGLVACQFDEIDNDGNFIGKGSRSRFAPSRFGFPKDIPPTIFFTPFVSFFSSTAVGPFGVYRRSVFIRTEGYVLDSQEDTDMFCQMSLLSEVHYIPEYLYQKRITKNNLAHSEKYMATHKYFRQKWDFYHSDDPKVNVLIKESLKYYYTSHKPLRDLKIGSKAFKVFLNNHLLGSLKWSLICFRNGLVDLFFRKTYRRILRERKHLDQDTNS